MKKFLVALLAFGAIVGAGFAFSGGKADAQASIDRSPDCDTVAIVKCGVTESNLQSKAAQGDISKVYAAFGIKASDLKGDFVVGVVWKNGNVNLGTNGDGALIATNAVTAGRWSTKKSGMGDVIAGTDRARKQPTSYFVTDGQAALIKIVNGQFKFAIIGPCGNPVIAKAVVPSVQCTGLAVKVLGREDFSFKASASLKNANFKHVTYTVKKSGTVVKTIVREDLNTVNYSIAAPGTYTVEAVITANAFGQRIDTPVGNCKGSFTVKETPEYACKSLTAAQAGDRTKFVFTTAVALKAATLKDVTYTVTNQAGTVVNTIQRTDLSSVNYTQPATGKYTVKAVVRVNVEGQVATAPGTCVANFEVKPVPVTPLYDCTALTAAAVAGQKNTYAFTLAYVADGGAELTKVSLNYGDQTGAKDVAKSQLPTFNYTYAKAGNYTATATLTFTVKTESAAITKTVTCSTPVTVDQEMCAVPGKENLPVDSPLCKEDEKCAVPGKETLPANSPDCFTPCVYNKEIKKDSADCKPTTLVNTGPGDVIGMFAATTIAGAVAHRLVWVRRFGR